MLLRCLIPALLFLAPGLRAAETLDRIVATVNGHALLQSDWDDELRYECFMSGRSLRDLSQDDRKAALNRLVDQELLREQIRSADFRPVTAEEVDKQMQALKADYARDHESQPWSAALASYGLSEATVRNRLQAELDQLRLVDSHLRPSIQVDPSDIEQYYKEQIIPKFPAGQAVSLQQATPKIRELLIQQKMNQLLGTWLDSLRTQGQVRVLVSEASPGDSK